MGVMRFRPALDKMPKIWHHRFLAFWQFGQKIGILAKKLAFGQKIGKMPKKVAKCQKIGKMPKFGTIYFWLFGFWQNTLFWHFEPTRMRLSIRLRIFFSCLHMVCAVHIVHRTM